MELTQKEILEKNKALLEAQLQVSLNRYELEADQITKRLAQVNTQLAVLTPAPVIVIEEPVEEVVELPETNETPEEAVERALG